MSVEYGFFNSVNGDRLYDANDMSGMFEGLISNGVFESVGNKLIVTASTGFTVNVGTGRAYIDGHYVKNTAILPLSLSAADVQMPRIDRVVIRCNTSDAARNVDFKIVKGTPSISPVAPALVKNETVYELSLATIYVSANATNIAQADITDTRANTSVCGYVSGVVKQVDTTDLFLQWQDAFETYYSTATADYDAYIADKKAAFDSWFSSLTKTLNVDVTIKSFTSEYTTTGESTSSIPVGIADYENADVLIVQINGIMMNPNSEYTVSGTGNTATINLVNAVGEGNTFGIICIKSVIGSKVITS